MDRTKNVEIAYHRNGIAGTGFHVVLGDFEVDGKWRRMVVVRFPPSSDDEVGSVNCAAFDVAELAKGNIAFAGGNSWRGDQFARTVDKLIVVDDSEVASPGRSPDA